jgi:2,3-dihydroxybenzoate-AMP ligase
MRRQGLNPWPAERAAAYRAAGYWRGETFGTLLWQWAQRGERVAVVDGDVRITYRELAERADALAEALATGAAGGRPLRNGDNALVQLPNCWEFVVVTLALLRLGVAPVMMLLPHRESELGAAAGHVGARALIVPGQWRGFDHAALADRVAADLDPRPSVLTLDGLGPFLDGEPSAARRKQLDADGPEPGDIALFLLSGGTTGRSKIIARTHDDYAYNARRSGEVSGLGPDSVYLAALPAGHNFPLASPGILGTLTAGGRVVLAASPRPEVAFPLVARERVTITSLVPAVAVRWAEAVAELPDVVSSLEVVQVGGSVMAPDVAERIGLSLKCQLQQVYGMAEGLLCYTPLDAPDEAVFNSQGRPVCPDDEVLLADPDGALVPPGGIGELLTRGPYTPRGYFASPEQNARSFTTDGWYRSGDLVRRRPDGNLVVCGRVKDLINRGGEKISAAEVEALVQELPQVAEVAAVPVPDPVLGEKVCLCVVPRDGAPVTLQDVAALFAARGVARFKVPERLECFDVLPHTPVGKIDKAVLRDRLAAVASA